MESLPREASETTLYATPGSHIPAPRTLRASLLTFLSQNLLSGLKFDCFFFLLSALKAVLIALAAGVCSNL